MPSGDGQLSEAGELPVAAKLTEVRADLPRDGLDNSGMPVSPPARISQVIQVTGRLTLLSAHR